MKTLKAFFHLARPFWGARQQWRAWLLLGCVIALALAIIWTGVWINEWNKTFYDALAEFNGPAIPGLILAYLFYIGLTVFCIATGNWLRKRLIFQWRQHMTEDFQRRWLAQNRHYRLQQAGEPDNPDQRIAEDIRLLTEISVNLLKYFLMNAAKLVAFVAILWNIGGDAPLRIGDTELHVPGYLVWIALAFSILCTILTHLIGRYLKPLNVERQHREADYRAALLRVRDNAEQIALYQGGAAETGRLDRRFDRVRQNWLSLIACEFRLESFSATYLRLSMFIPIIATLPMYLARTITFGDMMQARNAFSNVQDGFGWFMDYYKTLIEWAAIIERLSGFAQALDRLPVLTDQQSLGRAETGPFIHCGSLTIADGAGRLLLQDITFTFSQPGWVLLDGPSGTGKSTLIRSFARLCPPVCGDLQVQGKVMFLPQKSYLPEDSLRQILSYPASAAFPDAQLQEALEACGMPALAGRLDEEQAWSRSLSGGEQQRLSLARVLLHRPQILFLDEAMSQLDTEAALQLTALLRGRLPDLICLGVTHSARLKAEFDQRIDLTLHVPQSQVRSAP